ncbi:MAG: T9SS type B sorting domain-containing protein, partial [Bacteroidota bacterium]
PLPVTPTLVINGTSKYCANETRLLKVESQPGTLITWYRNTVSLGANVNRDTLSVNDAASYSVQLVNASGCVSKLSNSIRTEIVCPSTATYIPDAFTPNGDGINDVIRPVAPGIVRLKWFKIYNRWGNLLYESSDLKQGWNGTYRGQQQPPETYIWLIEGVDTNGKNIKKTGMLSLIR